MITANIQEKKLNIIEQLIIINDVEVFEKIEKIINLSLKRPTLKKLSQNELIARAKLFNIDEIFQNINIINPLNLLIYL